MGRLYGIVDTARDPGLYDLVTHCPNHACLFAGEIKEPLNRAAPYLVELTDGTALRDAWRGRGWGQAWGILLRSPLDIRGLRRHLRKFLLSQLPDGEAVLFRYYDPRVWRSYWEACPAEDRSRWLEGVDEFIAEPAEYAA